MAYQDTGNSIIIDGWENGIASSPYLGIANIRNVNTSYYPGVAYINYRRQATTLVSNVIDSYIESNFSNSFSLYSGGTQEYVGQSFFNLASDSISQAKFYLSKTGSPTGTMAAEVYAATVSSSGQYYPTNSQFTVNALVVAAGGGGSTASGGVTEGGGGGGGQVLTNSSIAVTSQAYSITVGTGGSANSASAGGSSTFSTLTATGGLGAGSNTSGGGTSPNGSSGAGGTGVSPTGGSGGTGINSSITGSSIAYGGGGGGAISGSATCGGTGGSHLGTGSNGTANRGGGGGGGGGSGASGGNGGSGVVIISYSTGSLTATGGTITTSGGNTIHTFTTSGTWTVTSSPTPLVTSSTVNVLTLTDTPILTTFSFTPTVLSTSTYYIVAISYTGGDVSDSVNVGYATTQEYPLNVSIYSPTGTGWLIQPTPTVTNLIYYVISSSSLGSMTNPVAKATSQLGLNYILDDSGKIWKQSAVNSSTFNLLGNGTGRFTNGNKGLAYFNNYLFVFGNGVIEVCGNGTGDGGIISSNWNVNSDGVQVIGNSSTLLTLTGNYNPTVNDTVIFTTTGTLPAGLSLNTTYYVVAVSGAQVNVSATMGGGAITITSVGTGINMMVNTTLSAPAQALLPLGNVANITFSNFFNVGDTSATITSYTNPEGVATGPKWEGATGQYNILSASTGNNILATFTNGSATVSFLSPIVDGDNGAFSVQLLVTTVPTNKAYVSKVDGNLYFANGRNVGRILSENVNTTFNPAIASTYVVDYAVTELLKQTDTVVDMVDLQSTLIIAGQNDIYTWDYISSNVTAPTPVIETISSIVNLLNNIYIFAGQKGSIYISTGFSAQLFIKLPDFIAGTIDPVWIWGGIMVHRSKLFFQALAKNTSGTNLLAGIFSIIASKPQLNEEASGLVMENQNSYGLTPSAGALGNGVLIDNSPSANGNDSYYSAWSNGATTGGIDFNDTSLWQNFEPTIETDIIPIGKILDKKTFGNMEFKLDRPMTSGDEIKLFWRPSLSDVYTQIGPTFTNLQLSDYAPANISQAQWAQFKITLSGAASGSSFIPIRELTLYYD